MVDFSLQWNVLVYIFLGMMSQTTKGQECYPGSYQASPGECIMCEPGFYQPATGQTNCTICPRGRTTTALNNTGSSDCVPACDPGRYISLDRCDLCNIGEYQSQGLQTQCNKCAADFTTTQRGTIHQSYCVNSTDNGCTNSPCENNGLCVAVSESYYCNCPLTYGGNNCQQQGSQPVVMSVYPLQGPVSGGTILTLSGQYFSPKNLMGVYLKDIRCDIVNSNSTHISARTPDLSSQQSTVLPTDWPISVLFLPNIRVQTGHIYNFKPDPVVDYLYPKITILSGGTMMTINGSDLNSTVAAPVLTIISQYKHQVLEQPLTYRKEYTKYTSQCTVLSSNKMTCPTPSLTIPDSYITHRSKTTGLRRIINNHLLSFTINLQFDGVMYIETAPLMVYMNPSVQQFQPLVQEYMAESGDKITLQGSGLDVGLDLSQFNISVGQEECTHIELYNHTIKCTHPQRWGQHGEQVPVTVSIGNYNLLVGYLSYVYVTSTEPATSMVTTTNVMVTTTAAMATTTTQRTTSQQSTTTITITKQPETTTTEGTTTLQITTEATSSSFIEGITGAAVALLLIFVILITFCVLVVWSVKQRKLRKLHLNQDNNFSPPAGVLNRYDRIMNWLLPNEGQRNVYLNYQDDKSTPVLIRRTHPDIFFGNFNTPEMQRPSPYSYTGTPIFQHQSLGGGEIPIYQLSNPSPLSTPEMSRHTMFRNNSFPDTLLPIYGSNTSEMMFRPLNSMGSYVSANTYLNPLPTVEQTIITMP